ncbi:glycosyltransferase [Desulfovibrio sp. OttesenSCG-928-C06]|nr:glycosyltransferase [Desulfovibrio sp. OttesenSCG-928-C06]
MRKITPVYSGSDATPVLNDIKVSEGQKDFLLLGPAGPERELSILPSPFVSSSSIKDVFDPQKSLPVLIGCGLGHALAEITAWLEQHVGPEFHLAVVDKEEDIQQISGVRERYSHFRNIVWIDGADTKSALATLSKWQLEYGGLAFFPIVNTSYLRLDREYYSAIREALVSSAAVDFWGKARYQKFQDKSPRILLITSKYFLIGEIEAACQRMGIEYQLLKLPDDELSLDAYLMQLMQAVISFKPDFAMTINHLGVDREGVLQDFLSKIRLPFASWFVDNPHLILYHYDNLTSPWTAIFTWDADNLPMLRQMGFEHVFYLPLGTDHLRFVPPADINALRKQYGQWISDVSFVGNSMLYKVRKRLEDIVPPKLMTDAYPAVAAGFAESDERSVSVYLQKHHPEQYRAFVELETMERQLGYEAMLTWEATLQYRLGCVEQTLSFNPLIVGDQGWFELLENTPHKWRYFHELTYYTDLPNFYPLSNINFNCTSKQMKGAVNQRIFDVPAAGAFVLTDWREQIENLFEPGKEVICFHSPDEIPELIKHYLKHPKERQKVIQAARKRVLSHHCYENRLQTIIDTMRSTFGV